MKSSRSPRYFGYFSYVAALLLVTGSLFASGTAHAASTKVTAKAGAVCKPEGSKTTISGKSYVCANTSLTKAKKLVWRLAPSLGGMGGASGTGSAGGATGSGVPTLGSANGMDDGDGHGPDLNNPSEQKAFAAFAACVKKNGGDANLVKPDRHGSAGVQPTRSAAQQKAEAACASLRPKAPAHADHIDHNGGEVGEGEDD